MVRTAKNVFLCPAPTASHLQAITIAWHIRDSCQQAPIVLQFVAQLETTRTMILQVHIRVTKTKVGNEGIDLTGFTDLITTDRDFTIDTFFKDKYSDREVQRRKGVESYKQLVGEKDYYSAKS